MASHPQDAPTGRHNYWATAPELDGLPHQGATVGNDPLEARQQCAPSSPPVTSGPGRCLLGMWSTTTHGKATQRSNLSCRLCATPVITSRTSERVQDAHRCGNTIAANRPLVRRLIIGRDALLGPGAWAAKWLPASIWHRPPPRREKHACRWKSAARLFEADRSSIRAQRHESLVSEPGAAALYRLSDCSRPCAWAPGTALTRSICCRFLERGRRPAAA